MSYVDGFLIPVPVKKIAAYRRMAKRAGQIWRKYGALDYKECVLDDTKTEWAAPFGPTVKAKKGETVVFSYIVFKSRKHRDAVNAKVMKDPYMSEENWEGKPMPFDMKRMAYGGFKVIVDA